MVSIVIDRVSSFPENRIVYHNSPIESEHQQDCDKHNKVSETAASGAKMEEEEPYDPEVDSPSSWTTKSSRPEYGNCCDRISTYWKGSTGRKMALATRLLSNVILVFMTLCGIIYGALITIAYYNDSDDQNEGGDLGGFGAIIIFGSAVGGAIALILVNLSWSYRGKNHEIMIRPPGWCASRLCACCQEWACPTAQLVGTFIVILVSAILVPTYHESSEAILVLLFGILAPLLIMVNLPMLFDGAGDNIESTTENDDGEDDAVDRPPKELDGVEIIPGNLESHSASIQLGGNRPGFFFKLR